jgi:hypothetical protein
MGLVVRALAWVGKVIVSKAVLGKALQIVETAAVLFAENASRRDWAVRELMSHGIPENIARLAVEIAVAQVKR